MLKKLENSPWKGELGNFVLPDKEAINKNLKQFQVAVKSKEEVG